MTLTEFLEQRIAEEARYAVAVRNSYDPSVALGFNPARVLTECAAKRRIVELHPVEEEPIEPLASWSDEQYAAYRAQYGYRPDQTHSYGCRTCDAYDDGTTYTMNAIPGCPTIRALATIYADHPDFDPAWRPT